MSLSRAQREELQRNEQIARPQLSKADGKEIYVENCAVCHDDGDLGAPITGDKDIWKTLLVNNMDELVMNTVRGMGNMPPKGGCEYCDTSEIIAAVKYMVEQSSDKGDYTLW